MHRTIDAQQRVSQSRLLTLELAKLLLAGSELPLQFGQTRLELFSHRAPFRFRSDDGQKAKPPSQPFRRVLLPSFQYQQRAVP